MTQSFATQEYDALDGFDLDDDFITPTPQGRDASVREVQTPIQMMEVPSDDGLAGGVASEA